LVDHGATAHDTAADAEAGADVVITMLPTADATAEVMIEESTLPAMPAMSTWVQMATIGVEATEHLARQTLARRKDVAYVDAPVSGSRVPAETGQLLILASGPRTAVTALEPVVRILGRETLYLGTAGAGSRMKLVLNTWLALQTEGAAEAAALAERLGIHSTDLFAALRDNPLASPYAVGKLTRMVERDFDPDLALDWALKDLDLVAAAGGSDAAPISTVIAERWRGLVGDGSSGYDVSAARIGLGPATPVGASTRALSASTHP
jgi:3-hydroxyisobutyrate dehydrogenase